MATVPVQTGPQVQQSGAPTPLQNVSALASAFGASVIGQGLSELGGAAQHTSEALSQYAEHFQAINNKIASDNGFSKAIPAMDSITAQWKADNIGLTPDGQPKAIANLAGLYTKLEEARSSVSEDMSPLAKVDYDAATRRYLGQLQGQATSYAVEQRKSGILQSSHAVIDTYQAQGAAAEYGTPEFNTALAGISKEVAFQQKELGLSDDEAHALLHEKVGGIFQSQVKQAIDVGDYMRAQDIMVAHKGAMTLGQIDSVAGALKIGATAFVTKGFAEDIANGHAPSDSRLSFAGSVLNNNPTNLKAPPGGKWEGQIGVASNGVVQFDTPAHAMDAAVQNLHAYGSLHGINTLQGIANRWAPAGDHNDPVAYAAALGKSLGIDPNAKLNMTDQTTLQHIAAAQIPLETGAHPTAGVKLAPPPAIAPNADPDAVRSAYDTYIVDAAHKLYGDRPAVETAAIQSARARIEVNIQAVAQAQRASYHNLFATIEGGPQGNAPRPLDLASLASAYPGAANDLAKLNPDQQGSIGQELNRANSPYGAFVTPQMQHSADVLKGMDPTTFVNTDLSKWDLSAADRKSFIGVQEHLRQSDAAKEAKSTQLKTYLSNPVVASVVKTNFPAKSGDDYNAFLGALQGQIERLQLKEGHSPTQAEISTVAQNLVTSKGGFFGMGGHTPMEIPDAARNTIVAQYQKLYGRAPYPNELNEAFQRGPEYYGR